MKDVIKDIQNNIKAGCFANEASVSQGIVQHLLSVLGWPVYNKFLEKFSVLPKHGQTRRFIARTKKELYPGRPDLANEYSDEIIPGWYLGTNVGRQ
ncbi:MAG: hypothetical protein ACM3MI_03470 [Clostridiales bacterium]